MIDVVDGQEPTFSADREFARLMWVALVLLCIALAGVLMATSADARARAIGVIVVTMVTGGIGGAAIGFLFGIPRVLTDASAGATGQAETDSGKKAGGRRVLASNSNLEQVSDWLTKIMLGVGLTQFYQLDGMLYSFERLVGRHVGPDDLVTPLIAAIVIVFAIIAGFLTMYLETRLVLSRIFNSVEQYLAERAVKLAKELEEATVQLDVERTRTGDAQERAVQLETAMTVLADSSTTSATTFAPAAEVLKSAAASDQASPELKSIAAQALAASGRTDEADTLLPTGDAASVRDRLAAMQVALYKDPPAGFEETLAIAAELANRTEARGSADYWFYQAAAHGQQYRYLAIEPASDDCARDRAVARTQALDCIRRCLAIDAGYEIRFFWLMNPTLSPSPNDDDLADFAGDADFQAIVHGPAT